MDIFNELVERDIIAQTINQEKVKELINNGKAVLYVGFDPTADSLHIGHFMAINLLKRLTLNGNKAIALIGGGTARIGDPTGKNEMRKMLTEEQLNHNRQCIKNQLERFLGNDVLIVDNYDWLSNIKYIDFLNDIGKYFLINNMIHAECYKSRMDNGLTLFEFNYMPLQSYDFYYLNNKYGCNLQVGGDDQWSNMIGGVRLIEKKLNKEAYVMTIKLLLNKYGKKMGKTTNGALWLDENKTSPIDFYQYWRNINDEDVVKCLKMMTLIPLHELNTIIEQNANNINNLKKILAFELTKLVHGEKIAITTEKTIVELFENKQTLKANNIPIVTINKKDFINNQISIIQILTYSKLCSSNSDARRLIQQGGITINNNKILDINKIFDINDCVDMIIKKGQKIFIKINIKE